MAAKNPQLEIYQDNAGGWRWRLRAKNGKIVADSGEAYRTEAGVRGAYFKFVEIVYTAATVEIHRRGAKAK